jgi:FkbM family methyltransferase
MATFFWGPTEDMIVPTPEVAFLMHRDDSGLCQAHRVGIPEQQIIEFARQFGDPEKIFIDCGAHMGVYSVLLADEFAAVFAFEAQKRTFMQLCGNIFINEKENIEPIHAGVSYPEDHGATRCLTIVSEDGGGSTFCDTEEKALSRNQCQMVALDQLNIAAQDVGLIKLDVEGWELNALKGAQAILDASRPPLIFECNSGREHYQKRLDLFGFLKEQSYKIAQIAPFENMFLATPE